MPALELLTYGNTACPAAETALPLVAGDSAVVRNFDSSKKAFLLGIHPHIQSGGIIRIKSPRMHDNVSNFRIDSELSMHNPIMLAAPQPLFAQDQINVTANLTTGAGDINLINLLLYYEDLPGSNGNYQDWNTVRVKIRNIMTCTETFAIGATFAWSGTQIIVADEDLLKANTNYAVLGLGNALFGLESSIRGSDTGNLRVGFPTFHDIYNNIEFQFVEYSKYFGLPTIPIINSANKGNTFIESIGNENTNGANVSNIYLAELSS